MIKGIITSCKQSTAKTGSPYCTIIVKGFDSVSTVNVWGATSDKLPLWKLFKTEFEKTNDQGISVTLAGIRISEPTSDYSSLVPLPPTKEAWLDLTERAIKAMEGLPTDQIEFFKKSMEQLYHPYSTMPAAKSNHHVFPGGLLAHTYQLINIYLHMRPALPYHTNPFIVCISCLFHDYLKLSEYDPKTYDYQPIMFMKGHVVGSAEVLGMLMRKANFPSDLIMHCQHCILAHHGRLEWGSPVLPATPEAFTVHHCDMLSGHGVIFEDTPSNTKSFPLNTTIFHYDS